MLGGKHSSNSRLQSALRASGRGGLVFPLHGIRAGKCTCANPDCDRAGKHPLTAHGFQDATRDAAQIRDWWNRWPTANLGIVTGKPSGFVALDIDLQHGGIESLKTLERQYEKLPIGPCVLTGGGGEHRLFAYPGFAVNSKTGLRPGIDFKGDGGYVVGVGSHHLSGYKYLWKHGKKPSDVAMPPIPPWLLKLLSEKASAATQLEKSIPEGLRNTTLASLGGLMRSRGMTPQAVEAALLQENLLRCRPPLSNAEVIGIARSMSRYAAGDIEFVSASSNKEVQAERKKLIFRSGKQIAKEIPPEIPWIIPSFIAAGAITELDGKPKLSGKTTFVAHMVAAALDGLSFLGHPTTETKTVYLSEQPLTSFRTAMERAALLGRKNVRFLFWADTLGTPWHSVAEAAIEECKRMGAKILVVDTFAQFAGLAGDSENNAGDALQALLPLQKAAAQGIAVVVVRYERKGGGQIGDSGRGSSAFAGAVDIIVSLRRPEGNQPRNVRLLQAVSRFDSFDDALIELTDRGYRLLGAPGEAARAHAAAELLSTIPKSKTKAATINDLVKTTNRSRAQIQKLLDALVETDEILKSGDGHKGSPYRYFRA